MTRMLDLAGGLMSSLGIALFVISLTLVPDNFARATTGHEVTCYYCLETSCQWAEACPLDATGCNAIAPDCANLDCICTWLLTNQGNCQCKS
jgi:hypothetical protein